jgi:hypothetical protein
MKPYSINCSGDEADSKLARELVFYYHTIRGADDTHKSNNKRKDLRSRQGVKEPSHGRGFPQRRR